MDSTYATIVIIQQDQLIAQADMGDGWFNAAYTTNLEGLSPITNYISSGWIYNSELEFITNNAKWQYQIYFDDINLVLEQLGLYKVNEVQNDN